MDTVTAVDATIAASRRAHRRHHARLPHGFCSCSLGRDFDVHRIMGQRFLGYEDVYAGSSGFGYPYMPIASMYFAPLTFFDRDTALALRYSLAIACLCFTLIMCYRMARTQSGTTPTAGLWMGAISIVLALQFILQDLDDGGPHLILLGILIAGIYSIWQGREKFGSLWFGLCDCAESHASPIPTLLPLETAVEACRLHCHGHDVLDPPANPLYGTELVVVTAAGLDTSCSRVSSGTRVSGNPIERTTSKKPIAEADPAEISRDHS